MGTQAAAWPGERATQLLRCAAGLRWDRPDLVAGLAEHALEIAGTDDDVWAEAAGWLLHARSAVGDGRPCAITLIEELGRRRAGLLDEPGAARLRVEIALIAAASGRPARAREIVAPVLAGAAPADVRADAFGVLARCVAEERPEGVAEAARRAEVAWAEVGDADAEVGAAAVALVAATSLRRAGQPGAAVGRAADGLGRLDQVRGSHPATPSRHLAAALAAEWIGALVDDGRLDDAREGCGPLQARLREPARPSRQIALLRLTVARADAGSGTTPATQALLEAADDAAAADTPELEAVCLSALGALHEKAGRLDVALETVRRGVNAQRRDAARREAFLAALRDVPSSPEPVATVAPAAGPTRWTSGESPIGDLLERTFGVRTLAGARHGAPEAAPAAARPEHAPAELTHAGYGEPPQRAGHAEPGGTASADAGADRAGPVHGDPGRAAPADAGGERATRAPKEPWGAGAGAAEPVAADAGANGVRSNGAPSRRTRGGGGPPTDPLFGDLWPDALAEITAPADDLPALPTVLDATADPDPVTPQPAEPGASPHPLAESPWSTGWWSAVQPASSGRGGRRQRPEPAAEPSGVPQGSPPSGVDEWLRSAMAELDKVWGGPFLSTTPAAPSASTRPAADREVAGPADSGAVGCVVVVDVTRAGEPVADDRAVAAVDAVAGHLDSLPAGARMRRDGPALSIVMPGRDRTGAAEWMHRNLPGVFADCATTGADGGLALRASVHDVDGPVGAQLVQRLAPARRHGGSGSSPDAAPAREGGRRRRPEPGEGTAPPAGPTWDGTTWVTASAATPPPPMTAGHARPAVSAADDDLRPSSDPAAVRADDGPGSSPQARRGAGDDTSPATDQPASHQPAADLPAADLLATDRPLTDLLPTYRPLTDPPPADPPAIEGPSTTLDPAPATGPALAPSAELGLADLLAGALAAYRGM